jgi:hypothetical protein
MDRLAAFLVFLAVVWAVSRAATIASRPEDE